MKKLITLASVLALAFASTGCAIRHDIKADYPQYLSNNRGGANLPPAKVEAGYQLTPATQQHHYEFRSALVGYANIWMVDFGEMLDQTLRSQDVQTAFGKLDKRAGAANGIVFDLQSYSFHDLGAHIALQISVSQNGRETFAKTYRASGKTQGGKMFVGGVFAMRNAVQQSTKLALDEILREFLTDLNANAIKPASAN